MTQMLWAVHLRYPSPWQYLADSDGVPWPYSDLVVAQERAEFYGGDVVDYPTTEVAKAKAQRDEARSL